MKRILLLVTTISLLGCSKDDVEEVVVQPTTYQVVNDIEKQTTMSEYIDGTLYDVVVFKFRGDDLAGEDNLGDLDPDGGASKVLELDENIDKVKVSFEWVPKDSPASEFSERNYTASYTFITQETDNVITITGETMVSDKLMKADGSAKNSDVKMAISQ